DGKIIGGRYVGESVNQHPDFTWVNAKINPYGSAAKKYFGDGMATLMQESGVTAK
ncbi:MAG: hypothetical protein HQK50_05665, partial [Oligoflexia bacterium]|nr:hypothetical protein [Oligoflexia bacterium]